MAKTPVYAVRDSETKIRLSYRYRDRRVAVAELTLMRARQSVGMDSPRPLEVYRTTQDLPRC